MSSIRVRSLMSINGPPAYGIFDKCMLMVCDGVVVQILDLVSLPKLYSRPPPQAHAAPRQRDPDLDAAIILGLSTENIRRTSISCLVDQPFHTDLIDPPLHLAKHNGRSLSPRPLQRTPLHRRPALSILHPRAPPMAESLPRIHNRAPPPIRLRMGKRRNSPRTCLPNLRQAQHAHPHATLSAPSARAQGSGDTRYPGSGEGGGLHVFP